jgi:dTDP-4-amino-4,6-dideoxygalactose transaminase
MCTFSFHPVKAVTTGEGGAVTTNSVDLASRLRRFRNHGIVKGELWEYDVAELGFNYRLTDVQAALGLSQLQRLDGFVSQRNRLALRYCEAFLGTAVEVPPVSGPGDLHAYHLFPVQVDDRRRVFESLRDRGVGVQVHYVPIYRHSLYRDRAGPPSEFPVTEAVYERLISLPLYPDLRDAQQDCVIDELLKLL